MNMIKQLLKATIASTFFWYGKSIQERGGIVTWITPSPTEGPTYRFPTKAPVVIEPLFPSLPMMQQPFFTSLPTRDSPLDMNSASMPSSKVQAKESDDPKLFNASKSSKDPKASKLPVPTTKIPKNPPSFESPTYSPSEKIVTPSPTTPSICKTVKWHPDDTFRSCTNSPEYPKDWSATSHMEHHYFRATLQQCCEFVFGPTGYRKFEDVCSSSSPSIESSDSPTNEISVSVVMIALGTMHIHLTYILLASAVSVSFK